MEARLRERLLVTGEMAEKFFPKGFCQEVLDLVGLLPARAAADVLSTYDYFLQTQQKYQAVAHEVYLALSALLRGEEARRDHRRLDFLVEMAREPYEEEYLRPLRRALQEARLKPADQQRPEDLARIIDAISTLSFVMQDSPAYPSERALKFYQTLYDGQLLRSLSADAVLRRVTLHGDRLLAEHVSLQRKPRPSRGYTDAQIARVNL